MIWKVVNLKLFGTLNCCAKIFGQIEIKVSWQRSRQREGGEVSGQGHTNYTKEELTVLKAGPDLLFGPTSCWATEHEVLSDFVTRAAHPEPDITKPQRLQRCKYNFITQLKYRCKAIHYTIEIEYYESDPIRLENTSNLQCRWPYYLFLSYGCLSHSFYLWSLRLPVASYWKREKLRFNS